MKIAYILPSLANAGPIIVARDLVQVMLGHGHECVVYYLHDKREVEFPCKTEKLRFWQSFPYAQYDVVHSHCMISDIFQFLHKPLNCKTFTVSTIHNFIFEDIHSYHSWLYSEIVAHLWLLSLTRIDKLAQLSKLAIHYYSRWYPKSKQIVAYNTRMYYGKGQLSDEEKEMVLKFKGTSKLIGINASLIHRKGIDQVINAMTNLPNCKLIIIGTGNMEQELKNLSSVLGVADRILFTGYVRDAYRFLPYYDLYVMCSRSEGFSLCTLEAVSCKINTVMSDIPLFRELYDDSETTFFQLENHYSLVSAIKSALVNSKAESAYAKYEKCFSPEVFYKTYLSIYSLSIKTQR